MDCNLSPYLSSRPIAIGKRGAVATAQPQAALAGIEMLLQKAMLSMQPLPWPLL